MSTPSTPVTRLSRTNAGDTAGRLLAALPEVDAVSPHAKGRVWAKLRAPKRRGVPLTLRVLAFAVLLLASAALAESRMHLLSAFTTASSLTGTEHGGAAALPTASTAIAVTAPPALAAPEPAPAAAQPTPDTEPEPATKPLAFRATHAHAAASDTAPAPSSVPLPAAAPTQEPPRSTEEAELVLDGLRALRKEGNPARAQTLFSQYLERHPSGALAEDAMGYQLEAADRMNAVNTSKLAQSYLSAFPQGRYVALARRLNTELPDREK